ncbi:MAG: PQQ-dependent sugar dehydrogenase [Gemmatimonadota bacterium]
MKLIRLMFVAIAGCSSASNETPPEPNGEVSLRLQTVVTGLNNPVHLTAPAGDARLFIVEQPGRSSIVQNGQLIGSPFLDIVSKVRSGGEQGLLSVAFHPQYASNGYFFVNYTNTSGDTRIERYRVSSNPNVADPASAKLILGYNQPFSNHNGGHVLFGPDGMLYIPTGDGGSGGDPNNSGQTRSDLLGDLLRIDVNRGDPYEIPNNNPFVGMSSVRNEIWAYGLRNPWRIAFDRVDGILYIADVGQNQREEINAVPAATSGLNYGWRIMEGRSCFSPSSNCNQNGLTLPVVEYDHGDGCSVTGGLVYRGTQIPEIVGHYFYGDHCSQWVRSFRYSNGQVSARTDRFSGIGNINSFGEDGAGELYVATMNGTVSKIVKQ